MTYTDVSYNKVTVKGDVVPGVGKLMYRIQIECGDIMRRLLLDP